MREVHEMLEHAGAEGAGAHGGELDAADQLHLPPLGPPEEEVGELEEISLIGKISSVVEGNFVVTVRTKGLLFVGVCVREKGYIVMVCAAS
jgi:hypothetical protein